MSEINIVGKIGNFYSIKANKSDLTIGLWHESIPSTSWQLGSYEELLNGPNKNELGFKSYRKMKLIKKNCGGKSKGIPGIFFHIGDPGPNIGIIDFK